MHLVAAEPQRLAALILREAHVLQRRDSGLRRRAGRRVRHVAVVFASRTLALLKQSRESPRVG